ncbi:MAG TPA: CoA-binding protein [Thermoanaerobaculia bacterium]
MAGINDPDEIARALKSAKTIAVVGCSPEESRPSNAIARYLLRAGFDVIPVNPGHVELLGRPCYPDLASVPKDVRVDIVDVFRRSEFVPEIANAALARGAGFFWMQDGVVDEEAARRLTAAGIPVAMDRCIFRDHSAL